MMRFMASLTFKGDDKRLSGRGEIILILISNFESNKNKYIGRCLEQILVQMFLPQTLHSKYVCPVEL